MLFPARKADTPLHLAPADALPMPERRPASQALLAERDRELEAARAEIDERYEELAVMTRLLLQAEAGEARLRQDLDARIADLQSRLDSERAGRIRAEADLIQARADSDRLRRQLADREPLEQELRVRCQIAEEEVRALVSSTSWRLTGPLRRLVMAWRRLRGHA